MAADAAKRRRRAWVVRPAKPVWYGPVARAADRWAAVRDARAGLPDLEAGGKLGTARCEYLGRVARERAERERLEYLADCADLRYRLDGAAGRLRAAREQLRAATEELAATPAEVPAERAEVRRAGEARHGTDLAVVRVRRAREHARERAPLVARVRQARDRLAALEVELADTEAQVQVRFRVAQTRARRVAEHIRRRGAAYLERLAQRHPQGGELNAAWSPDWPELPDWVHSDRSPDLSRADPPRADLSRNDPGGSDGAEAS